MTCAFANFFDGHNASSVFNDIEGSLLNSMENKDDAESSIHVSCSDITDLFFPIIIILFSWKSCVKEVQFCFLRFEKSFISLLLSLLRIYDLIRHSIYMFRIFFLQIHLDLVSHFRVSNSSGLHGKLYLYLGVNGFPDLLFGSRQF